ncbi:hypothetical protein C6C13_26555 (plasmid) [Escherichia coli]|nr:hypothetical protein C6C13_26555 [Escherichia coli]
MYVFLGGRMYKKKGVGCTKKGGRMYELGGRMYKARGSDVRAHWGGRMYVDNFMFQQLFYRLIHLIHNLTQSGGVALTRNKKGPHGPIFLLP